MTNRLGGALSPRAVRAYLSLRARYRGARVEVRRLQNQLREQAEDAEIELEGYREQHEAEIARLQAEHEDAVESLNAEYRRAIAQADATAATMQQEHDDLKTLHELQRERADTAEQHNTQLEAEIDIFKARDELWAQWETRERARLEAETARLAASKVRSLELPHYDQEQ